MAGKILIASVTVFLLLRLLSSASCGATANKTEVQIKLMGKVNGKFKRIYMFSHSSAPVITKQPPGLPSRNKKRSEDVSRIAYFDLM